MGPIDFNFRGLFILAAIGIFAVLIGVPVALFFLIRFLLIHLAWI